MGLWGQKVTCLEFCCHVVAPVLPVKPVLTGAPLQVPTGDEERGFCVLVFSALVHGN